MVSTEDLIKKPDGEDVIFQMLRGMGILAACYEIPEVSTYACRLFRERFGMDVIQIVGNAQTKIKRVGVLVGGGSLGLGTEEMPMKLMKDNQLDLAICGDITEWTLRAYVKYCGTWV